MVRAQAKLALHRRGRPTTRSTRTSKRWRRNCEENRKLSGNVLSWRRRVMETGRKATAHLRSFPALVLSTYISLTLTDLAKARPCHLAVGEDVPEAAHAKYTLEGLARGEREDEAPQGQGDTRAEGELERTWKSELSPNGNDC